jgi:two-component system C4-dicarboxylate transport response regulator DctD
VLFVEDEPLVRQATAQSLELAGFVLALPSAEAAMPHPGADFPGVLVTDVRLSGASGLDLLQHCRNAAPGVPVILVTGHGDITMAVQAMREGAYDFIEKPFGADRLTETVRRALERARWNWRTTRCAASWPARGGHAHHRPAGDRAGARPDRQRGGHRRAGDDQRRDRHRQGTVARSLHALSTRRDRRSSR